MTGAAVRPAELVDALGVALRAIDQAHALTGALDRADAIRDSQPLAASPLHDDLTDARAQVMRTLARVRDYGLANQRTTSLQLVPEGHQP